MNQKKSTPYQNRKGQWLVIGAFLVVGMLSLVLLADSPLSTKKYDRTFETQLYNNIEQEFGVALNAITTESTTNQELEENLLEYLEFVNNYGRSRSLTVNQYVLVGIPKTTGLDITIANYVGEEIQDLEILVNGKSSGPISISHGSALTTSSTDTSGTYNITYSLTFNEEVIQGTHKTDRRIWSILGLELLNTDYIRKETVTS